VNYFSENIFPRELSSYEKDLLFSVLPENKPGYFRYREIINGLIVAGKGELGESNLILCPRGSEPDSSIPFAPVFALGSVLYENNNADIVIHEEIDNQVEFEISFDKQELNDLKEVSRWSYSNWNPGKKAPGDGSLVREVKISKEQYILAVAPVHKKIWLYESESGINYILPVSNLYSYLMLVKNEKLPEIVHKPALFYTNLDTFSDEELKTAFIAYNKYFKRLKLKS
jgi:hypothetical protein